MHIYGPTHLHGPQPIGPPHNNRISKPETNSSSAPINDELQISSAAQEAAGMVEKVNQIPDIRQDRVDAIRAQIEAGTYETDEKIQTAVERLLDEIG
ncbi:MAG: flagellar biosynthesis anti-sigma factor FlgM [Pirellulales bacterium]|nr:flagellar biosynthesis anti-sigma factor FlgM [Pirellulales bacterium]